MAEVVADELENDTISDEDPGKVAYANKSIETWLELKNVIQQAEKIESLLPWKSKKEVSFNVEKLAELSDHFNLTSETVHLDIKPTVERDKSFVFVAPRYFRGKL